MKDILPGLSISTRMLVEAALERGLPISRLPSSRSTFVVTINGIHYIWKNTSFGNSISLIHTLKHKLQTHYLLKNLGYTVPHSRVFTKSERDAAWEWSTAQKNIVIKPMDAAHGDDITVDPPSKDLWDAAWSRVIHGKEEREQVLIEEYIGGEDFRLLVVGTRCIYVMHRLPAMVTGDGLSTIQELIKRENRENPLRGEERYVSVYSPISIDKRLEQNLKSQGMDLETVLKKNEELVLRRVCNVGAGGTERDITMEVSETLQKDAIELCRVLNADILAIDIRCEDITTVNHLKDCTILELNGTPGITLGNEDWVANAVWDALLEKYTKNPAS